MLLVSNVKLGILAQCYRCASIGHATPILRWLLTILHIMAKTKQVIAQKGAKAKKAVKAEPKKKAPPPKQGRIGTAALPASSAMPAVMGSRTVAPSG